MMIGNLHLSIPRDWTNRPQGFFRHVSVKGNNYVDSTPTWIQNPYRLISLGDFMRVFSGQRFNVTYRLIGELKGVFSDQREEDQVLSAEVMEGFEEIVSEFRDHCAELALVVTVAKANSVLHDLRSITEMKERQGSALIYELTNIANLEMDAHVFMYLDPATAHLYSSPDLFGQDVAVRFRDAANDIEEAGKCLALNRSTAAVYHLMRVVETGMYALSAALSITNPQENWQNAIEQIEKAIRNLPKGDERKQPYSEAAVHFGNLKEAFRNRALHSGPLYTEEKAQQIFDNVKAFMQTLAVRLPAGESGA